MEDLERGSAPAPPIVSFIAGGIAGGVEALTTYPFEYAKTRAQLKHDPAAPCPRNPYLIISDTIKREGSKALYKGCSVLIVGSIAKDAVRFMTFDTIKRSFQDGDTGRLSPARSILAGMASGVVASTLAVTPTERIKTALIDDAKADKRFTSPWQAIRAVIREDGPKGLYRGFAGTTLKQAATASLRFGSYNIVKDAETANHIPQNTATSFANGAFAGLLATLATQPFDTVKTRSQCVKATTTREAVKGILQDGGVLGFWTGTVMRLSRTVVSGGMLFAVYELAVRVATMSDDAWGAGDTTTQVEEEEKKPEVPETDLTISTKVLERIANERNAEKEWIEKTAFDYEGFSRETAIIMAKEGNTTFTEAPRYEWKEEYGEVAPRDRVLEAIIFGSSSGAAIDDGVIHGIGTINVTWYNCGDWIPPKYDRFEEMPFHPVVHENLTMSQYEIPTPIQRACCPAILRGNDLIACAQTGSGKTAAFLAPIVSKLMGKIKQLAAPRTRRGYGTKAEPLVLIVAPTRELATQIFMESRKFCYRSFMRPCVVYGGADTRPQRTELEKGCDLLVGTPGRLQDFIDRGAISLKRVRFTVIDEADEMLDMGFEPQLRKLLHSGDHNEDEDLQILMFSATFPPAVRKLAKEFLADDFIRINVGRIGSVNPNVVQRIIYASFDKKRQAISDLLASSPAARTLIFVNSKREADSLDDYLWNMGLPTTSIHGDRTQREREDALLAFRTGKCPILIATDVASRGLDVRNVLHVINYDLPKTIEEYTHRIGRTARIGTMGLATTFWNDKDGDHLAESLVKTLLENGQDIPTFLEQYRPSNGEELKFEDESSDPEDDSFGGAGGTGDMAVSGGGGGGDSWGGGAETTGGDNWGAGGDAGGGSSAW
ncbi:ATP-dependent RNA helicase DED1 [Drechslerella dactyloides]|uniref:RNA helicase n=1 Tax=Drechslerella dactyloides TaxID=74499 RepID=A0AAD6NLW1_DREDA|nr:ATP-dependent RNA helicase DED1 [Drechslerella dactyloides]